MCTVQRVYFDIDILIKLISLKCKERKILFNLTEKMAEVQFVRCHVLRLGVVDGKYWSERCVCTALALQVEHSGLS